MIVFISEEAGLTPGENVLAVPSAPQSRRGSNVRSRSLARRVCGASGGEVFLPPISVYSRLGF